MCSSHFLVHKKCMEYFLSKNNFFNFCNAGISVTELYTVAKIIWNLRIKTDPVTAEADATEYVRLLFSCIWPRNQPRQARILIGYSDYFRTAWCCEFEEDEQYNCSSRYRSLLVGFWIRHQWSLIKGLLRITCGVFSIQIAFVHVQISCLICSPPSLFVIPLAYNNLEDEDDRKKVFSNSGAFKNKTKLYCHEVIMQTNSFHWYVSKVTVY